MLLQAPPLPPSIRTLRNEEFDRLHDRYPRLSKTPKKGCITCGDTGEYRWWTDEKRTEVGTWKCDCNSQWLLNHYLLNANIGLTYQRLGWADMTRAETGAMDKVFSYMERAEAYVRSGVGLILYGEMGTGKTALSSLLLKTLLAQGHDGYFTTFSEMIDTYTGGWNDKEERAWFHRRIKNAGVLVLDDIGREYQGRAKNGLPESTFDEVLRHRIAASTPTIITTNRDMTEMQQGYGGNVMSLLHERSTTYKFIGEDFRDQARNRVNDEADLGLTRPVVLA